MKKRILFVDDQPNVLSGLRRMLRGFRHEWEMEFAENGEDALAKLKETPFDVVISDMRMPGMNGAQLLGEVKRLHPQTVRIVLSGQSEQESIMLAMGPAHQYLPKPCDPETLKSTVARACRLRDKLADESLKQLVSSISTLPSLPEIYTSLVDELNSPDASIQRIGNLIAQDVAMTVKLLQMVNSSFFGLPRRIESPLHAATMLGLDVLRPLVLSASIFSRFEENKALTKSALEQHVNHSLAVSSLAQRIATQQGCDQYLAGDSLIAGMLHDVGQLVLATGMPDKYSEILASANEKGIPLFEAEISLLGASHAEVGAYLLGLWGFPDGIVEAVAFHHDPSRCVHGEFSPLTAVHVANVLAHKTQLPGDRSTSLEVDVVYLETIGQSESLLAWQELVQHDIAEEAPA